MENKLCKCGCGNLIAIKFWHKYKGIPNFIKGHASRCLSPELLRQRSLSAKKRTMEGRNNNFIGCQKGRKKTEQHKKKQSEAMKGKKLGIKRPEHGEKLRELARQNENYGFKDPELRAIAHNNREPGFNAGEKNGRYIDGRKNKPGYDTAISGRRRARKANQTPPDADFKKIALLYELAKMLTIITGEQYDVDHIIPLVKGGLHHEENLRVITNKENMRKGVKIISIGRRADRQLDLMCREASG